jgi:hypothetical protein
VSYSFTGIFTNTNDNAVIEAAKLRWPFCTIYRLQKPFEGIAIFREPEMISGTYLQSYSEKDKIENGLPEFSSQFPNITFIHLRTDCHGGDCSYDGFACRHGNILIDNRGKGPDKIIRHIEIGKLKEIVETLDVYIGGSGNFEPFERGFFDNKENIIYPIEKSVEPLLVKNKRAWWKFW